MQRPSGESDHYCLQFSLGLCLACTVRFVTIVGQQQAHTSMWVLQLLCADHSTVLNVIRGAIPRLPEAQQLCRGAVGVNDVQEALRLTSPAKHSAVSCTAKPCLGAHSDWRQDVH